MRTILTEKFSNFELYFLKISSQNSSFKTYFLNRSFQVFQLEKIDNKDYVIVFSLCLLIKNINHYNFDGVTYLKEGNKIITHEVKCGNFFENYYIFMFVLKTVHDVFSNEESKDQFMANNFQKLLKLRKYIINKSIN